MATESHFLGEDGEDAALDEVHESAGIAEASTEDTTDDLDADNIDLNAVLGGGIRKAPVAAESEIEPEPVEATA
jgi:small subunit ribosomal protein S2